MVATNDVDEKRNKQPKRTNNKTDIPAILVLRP